jgi:hypothetical protein
VAQACAEVLRFAYVRESPMNPDNLVHTLHSFLYWLPRALCIVAVVTVGIRYYSTKL